MKTAFQILLPIVILILVYLIYDSIMEPVRFRQEARHRESRVIERLKDIRTAQVAHRSRYGKFTGDLDSLADFIKYDSLAIVMATGTVPDTLTESKAVELGIVQRDTAWIPAKDSLFAKKRYPVDSLPYIPFSDGERFTMRAGKIERGLVELPVFEASCEIPDYMRGLEDEYRIYYTREEGLKVGSMIEASLDGNWE